MSFLSHAAAWGALMDTLEPTDALLLQALARGDRAAFNSIFDSYRAPLYAFLARLSGRPALAEDLLQETWLRLVRHAPQLSSGTQLRPWLFTVARNLYRSHRRWSALNVLRLAELSVRPQPEVPSPFEALASNESQRALERALARLPVGDREVILLCVVSGLAPGDAASVLGVSAEAARQRLARARGKLKAELESQEVETR